MLFRGSGKVARTGMGDFPHVGGVDFERTIEMELLAFGS